MKISILKYILLLLILIFFSSRVLSSSYTDISGVPRNLILEKIKELESGGREKAIHNGSIEKKFHYLNLLWNSALLTNQWDWYTSCSLYIQRTYPGSDYDFGARILDILARIENKDWEKAQSLSKECLEVFTDHQRSEIIGALYSYSSAMHYSKTANFIKSKETCLEYLEKYPNQFHKPAVEALLSDVKESNEFYVLRRQYSRHNFREAADILFDFYQKHPRSRHAQRALNYTFRALYHGIYYTEFLQRYDSLEPWWFEQSWADDIVFLKAAIFVRTGKGSEARDLLDFFEIHFPDSPLYNQVPQLRAESYVKSKKNLQQTISGGTKEVKKAFSLITGCLEQGIKNGDKRKFHAHLGMLKILSEKAQYEWETLDYLENIPKTYKLNGEEEFARRLLRARLLINVKELELASDELKTIKLLAPSQREYMEIVHLQRKIKEIKK